MIFIPILILLAIVVAKLRRGLFAAFLVLVATKSIMDAFWNYKIGPLSMLSVQGALIPLVFYVLYLKRKLLPKFWLQIAKVYVISLSFGVVWAIAVVPLEAFELIVLNVNIFLGFLLIPLLITTKERLRQFLIAMMICGLFPIIVSIYQLQTGVIFQVRETAGLTRYVGFYHDAFPTRFYGLMTLMSILLYLHIFKIKTLFFRFFLIGISGLAFLSIYAVFSKAAVSIIGLWVVLLLLFSKSRVKQSLSVVVGILVLSMVFGDALTENIEQLFSKEVGYQKGEVDDVRYTLAGRGYIWEEYWEFYTLEQSLFFQWFGDGIVRPVHNEFLRVLITSGIVGLLFLLTFILKMIRKLFKVHGEIKVFALMLFGMYIIDCIGLVPGSYYYYNILVWGIFGILLLRPDLFLKSKTA